MADSSIVQVGGGGGPAAVAAAIADIVASSADGTIVRPPTGGQFTAWDNDDDDRADGYTVDVLVWHPGDADQAGRDLFDALGSRTGWQLRLRSSDDEILLTHRPGVAAS